MVEEIRTSITIRNDDGLHARPAAQIVQAIKDMDCMIYLVNRDGEEISAKSILGVMMLAAEQGAVLGVRASGPEARAAILAIARILKDDGVKI